MAVAVGLERLSLGEVKERARALSLREDLVVSEAVDRILPEVELDGDAVAILVRIGLITVLNNSESRARSADPGEGEPWVTEAIRSRYQQGYSVGEITAFLVRYRTADGSEKPLMEFSAADLIYLEETCSAHAAGWARRGDAVSAVRAAVEARGVARVRDLSKAELRRLAPVMAEAWS